jgi:rare lipoprotein A
MKFVTFVWIGAMMALTACGGSDRPSYSGREESTAGVPGFSPDGKKKLHPNVKLGQSYNVGGKTYVPRYQPEYDEEGLASWYGPGFHGGKTANGESFSTHQFTAAHPTLPMPSLVRVTYLKTGRSAVARINDRGPFAHGRIIDLSRATAEQIGLLRDGVGKVRVEYLPQETEKFAELLATGRDPQGIDIEHEVMGKAPGSSLYANMAREDEAVQVVELQPVEVSDSFAPVATAAAAAAPASVGKPVATSSPNLPPELPTANAAPAVITPSVVAAPTPEVIAPPASPSPATSRGEVTTYVQVGAFANEANAVKLKSKVAPMASTAITTGNVGGIPLFRVRMGPFVSKEAAAEVLERTHAMGYADAKLVTEHY